MIRVHAAVAKNTRNVMESDKTERLLQFLAKNRSLQIVLERAEKLDLPDWYVGSGGIAHTVWNVKHGFDPEHGIKDYDLVYYDADDLSKEAEKAYITKGEELFQEIPVEVEIVNQARIHLWYADYFGDPIDQHRSSEDSIMTWPTTATAVGVRKVGSDFRVYALFGLDVLLDMVVRPNKDKITKEIYEAKVTRWAKIWPRLKIFTWEETE